MITDPALNSPNAVLQAQMSYKGQIVSEWWQFREYLLDGTGVNPDATNYLRMYEMPGDNIVAYKLDDMDSDFLTINAADDITLCDGSRTDPWEMFYTDSPNSAPVLNVGEWEYGWWNFDLDGDHIADGSNPLNWDSDGDWMVDWFEVNDDEEDGVRGDGSPLRYDTRDT